MEKIRSFEDLGQIERIMAWLYLTFKPLVEAKWFVILMSLIIFANPIAISPQVVIVFTSSSVAGIAVSMWCAYAAIQFAFVFYGIRLKSASIFFSMLTSFLESITIIIVVCIRS